jgi:hypothetical protein
MATAWLRRRDYGGLPTWRASIAGYDLDVQMLGDVHRRFGDGVPHGRWRWRVRRDGRVIAEGAASDLDAAQRAADEAAKSRPQEIETST